MMTRRPSCASWSEAAASRRSDSWPESCCACPLSLWERAGVRVFTRVSRPGMRSPREDPHPNPLLVGEKRFPKSFGHLDLINGGSKTINSGLLWRSQLHSSLHGTRTRGEPTGGVFAPR
jgi:hypothetical protein